jgi:hypothetical protein
MALFEKYPKNVRKMIALSVTGFVGLILIIVMIFVYTSKPKNTEKGSAAPSKISQFYNTILEKGQFIFQTK